jgi:hypothetical protein
MASSATTTTAFAGPSYVLASNGPMSYFLPPSSCLDTTTFDGTNYFLGYQSALGTDSACYPPVLTTAAPTTNANALTLQYYSPGACPDGWTYAMSYDGPGIPESTGATSFSVVSVSGIPRSTVTDSPDNTAYICCPDSYSIAVTTEVTGGAQGAYPICTKYDSNIDTAWSIQPGWPTVKPSSLQLFSHIYTPNSNAVGPSNNCGSYTVRASGIVVAWHATDSDVAFRAREVLTSANNGQMPPWP